MAELKIYPTIGDLVETMHGINGILLAVRPSPHGAMAFIATADERVFHCPLNDLFWRNDNGLKI